MKTQLSFTQSIVQCQNIGPQTLDDSELNGIRSTHDPCSRPVNC